MLQAFLEVLRRERYSTSLIDQAEQVLPRLITHLREKGVRDLWAVTKGDLEAYAWILARSKTRYGRPPSSATVAVHLSMLRRFFGFLSRNGWILQDPAQDLMAARADTLPRMVLSLSQARRLMSVPHRFHGRWWWPHVESRDHAILELLYGTGIRMGECVQLDVGDVDLLEGQLLVRNGKGRKDRIVPVPTRSREALDGYLRDARPAFVRAQRTAALFTSWQGRRLKPVTLRALLQRRAEAAKLPLRISPHVLRHSCATHLLQGGADVRHIQELLGHADIESTARYTRVATADLVKMIERCHPRERQWARLRNRRG